jgi:hypothetical protein
VSLARLPPSQASTERIQKETGYFQVKANILPKEERPSSYHKAYSSAAVIRIFQVLPRILWLFLHCWGGRRL